METATKEQLAKESFQVGFVPNLPEDGLFALRKACVYDDSRLIQGQTVSPPALQCNRDWPIEGCCAVNYAVWQAGKVTTVSDVEMVFAKLCALCDLQFPVTDPFRCRHFLNWFDDTPRAEMRATLTKWIDEILVPESSN